MLHAHCLYGQCSRKTAGTITAENLTYVTVLNVESGTKQHVNLFFCANTATQFRSTKSLLVRSYTNSIAVN